MVLMRRNVLLVLGAALALIGAGVTVLYSFQPWRTCSSEDTAAGCAMLDADAAVTRKMTTPCGGGGAASAEASPGGRRRMPA
jgi:hypothetical protein